MGRTKASWDSAGTAGSAIRAMLAILGNSNSIFHLLYDGAEASSSLRVIEAA